MNGSILWRVSGVRFGNRYFFTDSLIGLAIALTGSELDLAAAFALSAFGFLASLLLRIWPLAMMFPISVFMDAVLVHVLHVYHENCSAYGMGVK